MVNNLKLKALEISNLILEKENLSGTEEMENTASCRKTEKMSPCERSAPGREIIYNP